MWFKMMHLTAPEHGENVPVVTGNGLSQVLSSMILSTRYNPHWANYMPLWTPTEVTNKCSVTYSTFVKWVAHFCKY
jgi:hypothetical protein